MCGFLEDAAQTGKGATKGRRLAASVAKCYIVYQEKVSTMNKRVTIDMPEEMHKLLARHALEAGAEPDAYMMEILEQHLEDLHDIALAEAAMERLHSGERTYTWEEMERELGLEN